MIGYAGLYTWLRYSLMPTNWVTSFQGDKRDVFHAHVKINSLKSKSEVWSKHLFKFDSNWFLGFRKRVVKQGPSLTSVPRRNPSLNTSVLKDNFVYYHREEDLVEGKLVKNPSDSLVVLEEYGLSVDLRGTLVDRDCNQECKFFFENCSGEKLWAKIAKRKYGKLVERALQTLSLFPFHLNLWERLFSITGYQVQKVKWSF